jgi:DNA-binding NtrC family response regulator
MNGTQIADEIARIHPDVPVIFMSAHPQGFLEESGRLDEAACMIQKPFGAKDLLPRVREALRSRSPGREARRAEAEESATVEKMVLVVEDERAARMAITAALEDAGLNVAVVGDAPQALELCRDEQEEIAVLLTDYSLPSMKGDELAREVRKLRPDVAIVYMSGFRDLDLDPEGPLLVKPLDLDEIQATVEAALT